MSETNINEINNYNSPNQQGNNNQQFNLTINTGEKVRLPKFLTATLPEGTDLIGRDDDLATLGSLLESKDRVVLVNGIGGVGKTELCKRFFRSHFDKSNFKHFAWINYYSSLKESFALQFELPGISDRHDISMDDRFKAIISCLRSLGKECLLVVDNMDSLKDDDLKELKQLTNKVIVTSRIKLNGLEPYHLGLLPLEQCIELFYSHYNGSRDDEHLIKIIELAGRHTLTVELLAKTADSSATELEKFYSQLVEVGFNLNNVIQEKISTEYNEHDDDTFFNHLLKVFELSRITEEEINILTNLSILPANYIEINSIKEWLALDTKNELNSLIKKGWLEQKGFSAYMHPVIGEVIRYKTKPDLGNCILLVKSMIKNLSCSPDENPLERQLFMPFGESIIYYLLENSLEVAVLSNSISIIYYLLGNFKKALYLQLKSVRIIESCFPKEYSILATSYSSIGGIYQEIGDFIKSLDFQHKALTIIEEHKNGNEIILAASYNRISMLYCDIDEMNTALKFQLKAVKIRENILEYNHPDLAVSYSNLGIILKNINRYPKALEFQLKALEIRESTLADNHPELLESYNNLGVIYEVIGELDKALHYHQKPIYTMRKIYGETHPTLGKSYNNIAMVHKKMGNFKEALDLMYKAIDIQTKCQGEGHPLLKVYNQNLKSIYNSSESTKKNRNKRNRKKNK